MFTRTDLTVELPYHIEEQDRTEELESRNLEEKYRHHECATMIASPLSEERLISMEILGLEDRESSDDDDEDEGEEARFRYTENHI